MAQATAVTEACEVCDSVGSQVPGGRLLCPLCAATDRLTVHAWGCPDCRAKNPCPTNGHLLNLWHGAWREAR